MLWSAHARASLPATRCLSVLSSTTPGLSILPCGHAAFPCVIIWLLCLGQFLGQRTRAPYLLNHKVRRVNLRGDTERVLNDPGLQEVAHPYHRPRKIVSPCCLVAPPLARRGSLIFLPCFNFRLFFAVSFFEVITALPILLNRTKQAKL